MYQMPIRIGDAIKLRKSDLSGRNVLKISAKYGKPYTNRHGNPYRITRQLSTLKEARANAYAATEWIDFANKYMRHDIGKAIDEA